MSTTTSERARIELDDEHGTAVVYFNPVIPDEYRDQLEEIVAPLLAANGVTADQVLVALVRMIADEQAYERVCERKGLLL